MVLFWQFFEQFPQQVWHLFVITKCDIYFHAKCDIYLWTILTLSTTSVTYICNHEVLHTFVTNINLEYNFQDKCDIYLNLLQTPPVPIVVGINLLLISYELPNQNPSSSSCTTFGICIWKSVYYTCNVSSLSPFPWFLLQFEVIAIWRGAAS